MIARALTPSGFRQTQPTFPSVFLLIAVSISWLAGSGCGGGRELKRMNEEVSRLEADLAAERQTAVEQAQHLSAGLEQALAKLEEEQKLRVEGNRIILPNAVLFASGSVRVNEEGKRVLENVGKALAEYPGREIFVEGHTDNVPLSQKSQTRFQSNWELASARALAVLHHLRDLPSAEGDRFVAMAFGDSRPVGDNATEEGRKLNRRVVVVVGQAL